ncbi:MAG: hypothetical protein HQK75_17055 [Candidatus Magnetomorum sp.]|nr:hypothetical protein [Candidatus Magnetomorum sp.]
MMKKNQKAPFNMTMGQYNHPSKKFGCSSQKIQKGYQSSSLNQQRALMNQSTHGFLSNEYYVPKAF